MGLTQKGLIIFSLFLISVNIFPIDKPEISVPYTKEKIQMDGILNETAWNKAATIERLTSSLNENYQEVIDSIPTQIKLLWDEKYLYIAFICSDDKEIYNTQTLDRDDDIYKEDVVEVFLDHYGDGRQWIEIQVSPENQILDLNTVLTIDPVCSENFILDQNSINNMFIFREWNCSALLTATSYLKNDDKVKGWIAEIAIPANELMKRRGKQELEPVSLKANFLRYDWQIDESGKRNLIHMNWAVVQKGCPHISPKAMGTLKLTK